MQKKEFDILLALTESEKPLTQREIAEKVNLSLGTVNKIVKELTESGLMTGGEITAKGLDALEPYRVKRAIFLAAGFGSRMVPITFNTPKPLVRVHGVRMIDTLLDAVVAAEIPEIIIIHRSTLKPVHRNVIVLAALENELKGRSGLGIEYTAFPFRQFIEELRESNGKVQIVRRYLK